MPDCGKEHGEVCAKLSANTDEIKEVWGVLRTRLATRVFAWACSITGIVLTGIVTWLWASNGTLYELRQQQAVVLERIDHNKVVVTDQYTGLKESIKDLKRTLKKVDDD